MNQTPEPKDQKRQKYIAMGYPVGTAIPSGIPSESELETDPEVSAKRTAAMQQMAEPDYAQGNVPPPDQPFTGKLTIIWEQEKTEILARLELCEKQIVDLIDRLELYPERRLADCEARLQTLEKWALYSAGPNPPAFKKT